MPRAMGSREPSKPPPTGGCPFHAAGALPSEARGPAYRRPYGLGQNPGVRHEIALFRTYGSRSVSRLLDLTGQLTRHGRKRHDDANVLISHFMEAGWDGDAGARAIARMNRIHGHYRIPNEDFLFVLWTFIDFPIRWMQEFGWRPFTEHERQAWLQCWIGVGERMGMTDLPPTREAFDACVAACEAREFVVDRASRRTADATVAIMAAWLPAPLRGLVRPAAACLARPRFRRAVGYAEPSPLLGGLVRGAPRLRARVQRGMSFVRYRTGWPRDTTAATARTCPTSRPSAPTRGARAGQQSPPRSACPGQARR